MGFMNNFKQFFTVYYKLLNIFILGFKSKLKIIRLKMQYEKCDLWIILNSFFMPTVYSKLLDKLFTSILLYDVQILWYYCTGNRYMSSLICMFELVIFKDWVVLNM